MKKKISAEKMYPVRVISEQHTHITRERDLDDEWSSDDLQHDIIIYGVEAGGEFPDIVTPFQIKEGDVYYLVYVVYNTGDSFHREDGCVRFVDLFKTVEKANACAKAINEHYKLTDNGNKYPHKTAAELKRLRPKGFTEWTVEYKNEDDTPVTASSSWCGFFEQLSDVVVTTVIAQPEESLIRYHY